MNTTLKYLCHQNMKQKGPLFNVHSLMLNQKIKGKLCVRFNKRNWNGLFQSDKHSSNMGSPYKYCELQLTSGPSRNTDLRCGYNCIMLL